MTIRDPLWLKIVLIGSVAAFLGFFLLLPVVLVLASAFEKGVAYYFQMLADPMTLHAVYLSSLVVFVSVPLNVVFGVAASWAIARFRFRGRALLITLIDLPFSVSPVVSGLLFVLLFGAHGWFGHFLRTQGIQILFAPPGIILATVFITFPFVARELIPVLEDQGRDEEEAARLLGAGPWTTFFRITIPSIRWGLFYGIVLSTARALGEFGAVSVVSGHIRGMTNTVPLHVEILYNEYEYTGAFAVASALMLLSVLTLVLRIVIEGRLKESRLKAGRLQEEPSTVGRLKEEKFT
ncbi:MAG: sulfate ABC transporter permease subunit CysW [Spirochaetae bacterium HGW-Spirochaetae-10]|nr:MAG: sulfate ABC transporter permease subunit CysW [Spirochaetae bacterium HGW-Spirochaetae-10]